MEFREGPRHVRRLWRWRQVCTRHWTMRGHSHLLRPRKRDCLQSADDVIILISNWKGLIIVWDMETTQRRNSKDEISYMYLFIWCSIGLQKREEVLNYSACFVLCMLRDYSDICEAILPILFLLEIHFKGLPFEVDFQIRAKLRLIKSSAIFFN